MEHIASRHHLVSLSRPCFLSLILGLSAQTPAHLPSYLYSNTLAPSTPMLRLTIHGIFTLEQISNSDLSQLVLYYFFSSILHYLPWEEGGERNMIGEWLLACQVVTQMKLKDGEWRLGEARLTWLTVAVAGT